MTPVTGARRRLPGLPAAWRRQRLFYFGLLAVLAVFMIYVKPALFSGSGWRPCLFYQTTGLPCPLCGATRATRALLRGDFALAAYYNAIAFPATGAMVLILGMLLFEAVTGIPVFSRILRLPHQRAVLLTLAGLFIAWGIWHIADAVRTPKPELIRPDSPVCHFLLTHPDAGRPDAMPSPPR